jgi:hypothetical protein
VPEPPPKRPKKTFVDVEQARQILGSVSATTTTATTEEPLQKENVSSDASDLENQEDIESAVLIASFPSENSDTLRIPVVECNVCLEYYQHGDLVRKSKACEHVFHRTCISEWLAFGKMECPCCRSEFVNLPPISQTSTFEEALTIYRIEDQNA